MTSCIKLYKFFNEGENYSKMTMILPGDSYKPSVKSILKEIFVFKT